MKTCSKCKESKDILYFYKDKFKKSGFRSSCKSCDYLKLLKWREKNKDKVSEISKRWFNKNKDLISEKRKAYYLNNKETIREWGFIYREKNRVNIVKGKRIYYLKNKENILKKDKIYYQNNRERVLSRQSLYGKLNRKKYNKYERDRKRVDFHFKLKKNVSSIIRSRLNNKSNKSTFSFLPYTVRDLSEHLESKFKNGMSWDNYGKWHVDHIKPDCSFNYTSVEDEEFQKCWALSNLQPLWAEDNLRKNKF